MSTKLITRLKAAKTSGTDPRDVFEDWLHDSYKQSGWLLKLLFLLMVAALLLVGAGVMAYVIKGGHAGDVPVLSDLARMDENGLQWIIGSALTVAISLITVFLQLRNGQHKQFIALYMVMAGGDVVQAVQVMFDGKGGKATMVVELISNALGAAG